MEFKSEIELNKFKLQIAQKVIDEVFEIIPSYNNDRNNHNYLSNSVYRNKTTTEYFQLRTSSNSETKGQWLNVRKVNKIDSSTSIVNSKYVLKALLNGNAMHFGSIELIVEISKSDEKMNIEIEIDKTITNQYLITSAKFGIISGFEGARIYKPITGTYKVKVSKIGFHQIDSSSITIAYASNMAILRALDLELKSHSFKYKRGKFEIYKKNQISDQIKIL